MTFGIVSLLAFSASASAGWQKVDGENTFYDVAITKDEHQQIVLDQQSADFWGILGPQSVFRAWNTAAYDKNTNTLYFHGGGHSDYGGNEVYAYDIDNYTWHRITDPSPLVETEQHSKAVSYQVEIPVTGPISAHTYDMFAWNPDTQSIWTTSAHGYGGGAGRPSHAPVNPAIWEFTPADKSWKRHPIDVNALFPMSTYLPDRQQLLVVDFFNNRYHRASLIDADGQQTILGKIEGLNASGLSTMFTHPETGEIYSAHSQGIFKITVGENAASAEFVTRFPSIEDAHFSNDYYFAAFQYRTQDKKFYIWNGGPHVVSWDPRDNAFDVIWSDNSQDSPPLDAKGNGRVFDKFVYLEASDSFIGITLADEGDGKNGFWTWTPPATADENTMQSTFGEAINEGITPTSASFFVPMINGDRNYNAVANVYYRKAGDEEWTEGVQLQRIYAHFIVNSKNSLETSKEGMAGLISGLAPNQEYQVRIEFDDVDGFIGATEQQLNIVTPPVPQLLVSQSSVNISNAEELHAALADAVPGQTIILESGIYQGVFKVKNDGTADNPIRIFGNGVDTIIDGDDGLDAIRIQADHVHIANLAITNAKRGIYFSASTDGVVISGNHIDNVKTAVDARQGHTNLYVSDNTLRGRAAFGDTSSSTWNYEGIVVTGMNIEVVNNTVSGFGDSIGVHWQSSIPNISINIHKNLVLWGGDDGIEFDFSHRNVSAHDNLIANSGNGISFQPVFGGPVYAHHNLVLNAAKGPVKVKPEKDDPIGIHVYHNTFHKRDSDASGGGKEAWKNSSGSVKQLFLMNNLFISPNAEKYVVINSSRHALVQMDFNGWTSDGLFKLTFESPELSVSASSFEEWTAHPGIGDNDVLLNPELLFKGFAPDFENLSFIDYLDVNGLDLTLNEESPADNSGKSIFGISRKHRRNRLFRCAFICVRKCQKSERPTSGFNFDAPVAVADNIQTEANTNVVFAPVENDYDLQNDAISLSGIEQPSSGSISLQGDGNVNLHSGTKLCWLCQYWTIRLLTVRVTIHKVPLP